MIYLGNSCDFGDLDSWRKLTLVISIHGESQNLGQHLQQHGN